MSADFSTETLKSRKDWQEVFKVMKKKNLQPRIFYPTRLSMKMEGDIKSFPDRKKLKKLIANKPALQEMFRGLL